MPYFILFASLMITVVAHEAGHLFCAILCKVKVEAFCVGFFKPYLHKKWKGIDWRITPFLLGGYCQLSGENSKIANGFLIQPYHKKLIIALAGVFVNLIIALICYVINYGDIFMGLKLDWLALQVFFTRDFEIMVPYYLAYTPNLFLWQLSMINIFSCIVNLCPYPSLD